MTSPLETLRTELRNKMYLPPELEISFASAIALEKIGAELSAIREILSAPPIIVDPEDLDLIDTPVLHGPITRLKP